MNLLYTVIVNLIFQKAKLKIGYSPKEHPCHVSSASAVASLFQKLRFTLCSGEQFEV